ncbi:MAG TPA: ATP-binding protein [Thermoanaerobaculia bacterium]|nr:ATP-binding protein [Thermoanaerobaculia bacterium]
MAEETAFLRTADLLPEPMFLVSGEGIIIAANRCAAEVLGLAAAALQGCPLSQVVAGDPESLSRYLRDCSRSRQMVIGGLTLQPTGKPSEAFRSEGAVYRPRERERPALILLRLLPRADTTGSFLLLNERIERLNREIAWRRRAEEEVRLQREWLRVTLESIGDAVIATDIEGRVSFMNPVAQALTGWQQDEAVGLPLETIFHIINEETRRIAENPVAKVLREGTLAGLANHTVLISRDGREMPIDDCAAPIRAASGEILGVVMIFHDVVERRNLERELARRAERLAEADRRKDEFLAMLGHELRNPLAPIRNALHLLGLPGVSAPSAQRAREMMERQVQHLVRLVDDLLDVSRITRGKVELHREKLDLAVVVERAVDSLRQRIEEHQLGLAVSLPPEPLWVDADPTRLDQILVNLLNNAVKFTPAGGRIEVALRRENGDALLSVLDTGIGIPEDLLPDLFEPFTQSSRPLDRSQGGLGLGLTLVRRLVEMHGGSVTAHSAGPDQGSAFVVRLPLLKDLVSRLAQKAAQPDTSSGTEALRVLVVDDNRDSADSIALLLNLWGHEPRTVYDGRLVAQAVHELRPHVVLLDIGLPGLDGYELARRLREQPETRDLLLVAMTGYGQEQDRQRTRAAGFDHHLVKPVDMEALKKILKASA